MLTSETGTSNRPAARVPVSAAPRRRYSGFSLIEILVVIVIIGIVLSIAILSVSLIGGDKAIREEAQRMMALIEVARDESMLQGREFGVEFMLGAYRFVELDLVVIEERIGKMVGTLEFEVLVILVVLVEQFAVLARMLGGRDITDKTREHAREMLELPGDLKAG